MIDEDEPILKKAIGYMIFALLYWFFLFRKTKMSYRWLTIIVQDWMVSWKLFDSEDPKKEGIQKHKSYHGITKIEDCESFFKFFSPPQVPEDENDFDKHGMAFSKSFFSFALVFQNALNVNLVIIYLCTGWWTMKSLGVSVRQRTRKLEKVESLSRLVMGKRLEPAEDT